MTIIHSNIELPINGDSEPSLPVYVIDFQKTIFDMGFNDQVSLTATREWYESQDDAQNGWWHLAEQLYQFQDKNQELPVTLSSLREQVLSILPKNPSTQLEYEQIEAELEIFFRYCEEFLKHYEYTIVPDRRDKAQFGYLLYTAETWLAAGHIGGCIETLKGIISEMQNDKAYFGTDLPQVETFYKSVTESHNHGSHNPLIYP